MYNILILQMYHFKYHFQSNLCTTGIIDAKKSGHRIKVSGLSSIFMSLNEFFLDEFLWVSIAPVKEKLLTLLILDLCIYMVDPTSVKTIDKTRTHTHTYTHTHTHTHTIFTVKLHAFIIFTCFHPWEGCLDIQTKFR